MARAYLLAFAFWCGFALLMGFQYRPPNAQHFWPSLRDLVVEGALRGCAFAFWTPPIFFLVGRVLHNARRRVRYALLWSLGAIPFVLLNTSIVWLLVPPYDDALQRYMPRTLDWWVLMIRNGFADQIFIFAAVVVAAHAYNYLKRLQREEREKYEYQQALVASELQVLKMQVHPHFLFNTLHGIAALIDTDPRSAKTMIIKLSSLLRKALDRDCADLVPLANELEFIREYLDVEKMRLGPRLRVDWLIAPETRPLPVPRMILQPLAENAIRHGVAPSREGGWLLIETSARAGVLTVTLRNSVTGRTAAGTGLGLRNVRSRLRHLYSGDAGLHFEVSADGLATATMSVPALTSRPAGAEQRSVTIH